MMRRALFTALLVLVVGTLLLASCSSDDSSSDTARSSTTTTVEGGPAGSDGASPDGTDAAASEEYCRAVRIMQGSPSDQIESNLDRQLELAPDEIEIDVQVLRDNVELLDGRRLTPEDRAIIAPAVGNLIAYLVGVCGMEIDIYGPRR